MKLPVVAAIPNYNMGPQLENLLPPLAAQNYDAIFVLDDASTDGSREIVETFNAGGGVHFATNPNNRGAGAARNLIIPELQRLGHKALVHFMDADTLPETRDAPEVARQVTPNGPFGFVGGLVRTPGGVQSVWNYGPRIGLRAKFEALAQDRMGRLVAQDPVKAQAFRQRYGQRLSNWPDPVSEPVRRSVFWAVEQNLLVDSDVFATMGGFDEKLREHDIQDLAIRMEDSGLPRWFDPAIAVQEVDTPSVRPYSRTIAMHRAELYIARKHGVRHWLTH